MAANLHVEAMAWLRYVKQMPLVCTEVGRWNADVLGVGPKHSIEVEVKKSLSDLRADFRNKRNKHYTYGHISGGVLMEDIAGVTPATHYWYRSGVPNYLYFMVPETLRDKALVLLEEQNPRYGLLWVPTFTYNRDTDSTGYSAGKNVEVARKAQRLHKEPPAHDVMWTTVKRLSSELVGLYQSHEELERKVTATLEEIRANVRASAAVMAAFTPEPPDPTYEEEAGHEVVKPHQDSPE